jgi:hypothetical protein
MWNFIKGVNPIKKRKTEDKTPYYSEYESSLILLTKFDLSISNSLNQIHNEKISVRRHELHTDVSEDKTLYYSEYESSKRVRGYSTEWDRR